MSGYSGAHGALDLRGYLFNAVAWEAERNNTEIALLALAARTISATSAVQTNYNARGLQLNLYVQSNPGGVETLSIRLLAWENVIGTGGNHVAEFVIPAATNGLFTFLIYPGVTDAAANPTFNGKLSRAVGRYWYAAVVPSAAGSWTYALSVQHIL